MKLYSKETIISDLIHFGWENSWKGLPALGTLQLLAIWMNEKLAEACYRSASKVGRIHFPALFYFPVAPFFT